MFFRSCVFLTLHTVYLSLKARQMSSQLDQLRQLVEQLQHTQTALFQQIRTGTFQNPAPSCAYIHRVHPNSSSGGYWIQTAPGNAVLVYCDMERVCGCGNSTGWMRVAHLDMTREGEDCPSGLRLATYSGKRLCGRTGIGYTRTTFSVHGLEYSRVCGKVIGYQFGRVNGLWNYHKNKGLTLDQTFLDGVVLTHGSPRNHIWSFVACYNQGRNDASGCPCSTSRCFTGTVPPFIGDSYFCDSGSPHSNTSLFLYDTDPLWDGEGCRDSDHCCTFHNPPWFRKDLPQPTSDDIELRICGDEALSNEGTPIELVDIYIQ